jgi:hypothetical protein
MPLNRWTASPTVSPCWRLRLNARQKAWQKPGDGRALLADLDEDLAGAAVLVEADGEVPLDVRDAELVGQRLARGGQGFAAHDHGWCTLESRDPSGPAWTQYLRKTDPEGRSKLLTTISE